MNQSKTAFAHAASIDLHVHSNYSDGTLSPAELVELAIKQHLTAFALTDHDTVEGLAEAIAYAQDLRNQDSTAPVPEIIPGVELSTEYQGRDVHILGLYIDYRSEAFQAKLKSFAEARVERNRRMCRRFAEYGIDICYEALTAAYPDSVITRAHYADYLLQHGYVKSHAEAFDRYLGDHCPCFVPREKVTPVQAIEMILAAKGIPVLAHAPLYHMSDRRLEELIALFKEHGLMGLEVVYSTYTAAEERQMRALAAKYGLLPTGGSDFHGATKPDICLGTGKGRLYIPASLLPPLKAAAADLRKPCLLFTDMDGTLLNDNKEVTPAIWQGLKQMTDAGNRLVLSSGRPLPGILAPIEKWQLNFPGTYAIAFGGAQVYDCEKKETIFRAQLDGEDIREIIAIADKMGIHIHGYNDSAIVCRQMNAELDFYTSFIHMPLQHVENLPEALREGSYKLLAVSLEGYTALQPLREELARRFGDRILLSFSNAKLLEIQPATAGKGKALEFLADYLQIPLSHTYAAGDAENDLTMLEAAGTGVAIANAAPAVLAIADIITKADNNHDGLLEIIERLH